MFHGQLEGTGFEVLAPHLNASIIGHARVERLWTGARWPEAIGPKGHDFVIGHRYNKPAVARHMSVTGG